MNAITGQDRLDTLKELSELPHEEMLTAIRKHAHTHKFKECQCMVCGYLLTSVESVCGTCVIGLM